MNTHREHSHKHTQWFWKRGCETASFKKKGIVGEKDKVVRRLGGKWGRERKSEQPKGTYKISQKEH